MDNGNNISKKQNTESILSKLFVQREWYAQAKMANWSYLFANVLLVIASVFTAKYDCPLFVFFILFFVSLVAFLIKDYYVDKKTEEAAIIQEMIDVELFEIDWNNLKDDKIDEEIIISFKNKNLDKYENSKKVLANWYIETADLPSNIASLVCQKQNLTYDSKLRIRFNKMFSILLILLIMAYLIILKERLIIEIFAYFLPLLPIVYNGFQNIGRNIKLIEKNNRLKKSIEKILDDPKLNLPDKTNRIREIQNEIWEKRKIAVFIPDFFYKYLRAKDHFNYYEYFGNLRKELLEKLGGNNAKIGN